MFSVSLLQERFSHFTMRTMKTDLCTGENDESDENDENATWTDENKNYAFISLWNKNTHSPPALFSGFAGPDADE